jgi:type IV pilus assembly protein PilM
MQLPAIKMPSLERPALRLPSFKRHPKDTVVGVDFDAAGIAATEVVNNGGVHVKAAAIAEVPAGAVHDGEVSDPEALGRALAEMFAANNLSHNVRLGLANQKIAVRTLHLPVIDDADELETAIRFRAADEIPMPLDQAVMDYTVLGEVGPSSERRLEVVVATARRDMVSHALEALRQAGLRPVGIDLSAYGLIRALHGAVPAQAAPPVSYENRQDSEPATYPSQPARLYCNLGDIANLAVARGAGCLFTRAASFGVEGIAQRLTEVQGLTLDHARGWLTHVGLTAPIEEIDGDPEIVAATRGVLEEGIAKITDELRLSLDFYAQQEGMPPVADVVVTGPGADIPGIAERLSIAFGLPVMVGRPPALVSRFAQDASRLTLSYGLGIGAAS